MSLNNDLSQLNSQQLCSVINGMKKEIIGLKTDLNKHKKQLKIYEKYFDFFNQLNETISSNNKSLQKEIKLVESQSCDEFQETNDFIQNINTNQSTGSIGRSVETTVQLVNNEAYFEDNDTEDISILPQIIPKQCEEELIENSEDTELNPNDNSEQNNSGFEFFSKVMERTVSSETTSNQEIIEFDEDFQSLTKVNSIRVKKTTKKPNPSSDGLFHCDECNAAFKTLSAMGQHKNIHSDNFRCNVCGYRASTDRNLLLHKAHKHSEERPYGCPIKECDMRCKSANNLRSHLNQFHKIDRNSVNNIIKNIKNRLNKHKSW